jgi:malonyl-CoA decarboxylase
MIREVTHRINEEFPGITQFSTLSPIPGFRSYLVSQIDQVVRGTRETVPHFFKEEELMSLEDYLLDHKDFMGINVWEFLSEVVKSNSWIHDQDLSSRLKGPIMRKCAHYLYNEKEEKGYAVNPVGEDFIHYSLLV